MPLSIEDIQEVSNDLPPCIVVYGPPGVGKTSLAAESPSPIFIQVERGTPSGLKLKSFGKIETWNEVIEGLQVLAETNHDFKTVVIDSLDKLEFLIWDDICEKKQWDSIEAPGFGKGYKEADYNWRKLFDCLDYLREAKGMAVVLVCHSTVTTAPNPTGAEFQKWEIRLDKRAHAIVEDHVEAILMINYDVSTLDDKASKTVKGKPVKSAQSKARWIHCNGSPALNAKNRYKMPDRLLYKEGQGWEQLAPFFPQ